MKTLYLIGGTMGVGKTTACKCLRDMLPDCAFLDGDWCWDMHPFRVTDETKAMVMDNICHILNGFLRCSTIENIVFCWVMHQQSIIDEILANLIGEFTLKAISLTCSPECLAERLERDVRAGLRTADVIQRSLERIPLYSALDTVLLDTSDLTPEQTAQCIIRM